ncbi:hypothetical protein C6497_12715 [Candidatus Poribacteria bacterium]|nr:MAG: hypothetical protein C6497_12715 [Candidatus Poribacteria bacterium]
MRFWRKEMADNPKVFISYSHDSPEHKQWVSELAAHLRRNGIDAILDQWDLGLGDDITRFMERGIVDADRVLVICTNKYVSKANANEGGVGYERMIVNAELVQNLGTDKFIPIIRQVSGKEKTPTFLGTRVYADFRKDSQFNIECEKLIHELHEMPIIDKPPLGKSPFPPVELDRQLVDIPEHVVSVSEAYKVATKLARAGDTLGWRQLIKRIRSPIFRSLVQWQQDELDKLEPKREEPFQIVDKAVEIISPLIVVALAGVESGREEFKDQRSLLDDLQYLARRNLAGFWVDIPRALGYVYHSLHGSLCLTTNQLDLAVSLIQVKISDVYTMEHYNLWEIPELMGWSKSISGTGGGNCVEGWKYLVNAFERWEWLSSIFGDESEEYRAALVAYYMALNIHELAASIALVQQEMSNTNDYTWFSPDPDKVPLMFMSENHDIYQRAITLLRSNPEAVIRLWTRLNVTHEQMRNSWGKWIRSCDNWLRNASISSSVSRLTCYQNVVHHQDFFKML